MRFAVLSLLFGLQTIECARILGIFFVPGYSHFVLGETIFKELARRGHEVTVISAMPQKEPFENYKDVEIKSLVKFMEDVRSSSNLKSMINQPALTFTFTVFSMGTVFTDLSLEDENVQKLLHSNQTFDVIILEQFVNEAHLGFMHHFKAPLIMVSTTKSSQWTNTIMGSPTPYAYTPNLFLDYSPNMDLCQRVWNTVISCFESLVFNFWFLPKQDDILHKYFPDAPHISELMQNVSLIFLNSHPTLGAPVPLLPNMIEIGGFHVEGQTKKNLTDDLQKYLDDAKDGVIYFSMGSNFLSKDLDDDKLQHILKTFAKLKMKVLWKFEDDLPGKPSNVKIEKWVSQPAVLAHKNVKLFISHGGRLSLTESVYHGKPIIGIPLSAEQFNNIAEAAHFGYGTYISYQTLTEDILTEALTEILQNPKYSQEAKYRSDALRSLNVSPLENAIYWVEYVIKHKGAPHLKNMAVYLPLYQYLLLDVMFVIAITAWISKKILCILFSNLFGKSKSKTQKKKMN